MRSCTKHVSKTINLIAEQRYHKTDQCSCRAKLGRPFGLLSQAATGLLVYNKDNLHWASASEQSLNKSTHRTNAHAKPVWVQPLNGVWTAHLSAAAAKKAHPGISISRIKRVANRNLADACEKHEIKGHVCVWGTRESQEDLECGDDSNLPSPPPSNLPEDKRSAGPSMEKEL